MTGRSSPSVAFAWETIEFSSIRTASASATNGSSGEKLKGFAPLLMQRGPVEDRYQQQKPPSTRRSTPVQYEEASLARKIAGPTISSTLAIRPIGVCSSNALV